MGWFVNLEQKTPLKGAVGVRSVVQAAGSRSTSGARFPETGPLRSTDRVQPSRRPSEAGLMRRSQGRPLGFRVTVPESQSWSVGEPELRGLTCRLLGTSCLLGPASFPPRGPN